MAQLETHASSAPSLFLCISIFQGFEVTPAVMGACLCGGILEDVCHETSVVGRLFPVVRLAKRFGITVRHRGFTHSLAFIGVSGILLIPLILMKHVDCYLAFLVSVLQHQILDGLTPDGLLWLTPFSNDRFRFSPNPALTVPNGSGKEVAVRWVLISVMMVLLAINRIGPRWLLNYYFADVQASVESIHRWGNAYSLKAEFKATHMLTKEPIEGVWRVLGHSGRNVILQDNEGALFSIVDEYDSGVTLRADKMRVHRDKSVKVVSYRLDMKGRAIGELDGRVETEKSYRLFGKLILEEGCVLEQDITLFNPARISGRNLHLEFATLEHLNRLRDHVVEAGEVLVVYALGINDTTRIPSEQVKQVYDEFEVDDLSEIVVREGETIYTGKILAQLRRQIRLLDIKQEERRGIQAKIDDVNKLHTQNMEYLDSQKQQLETKIRRLRNELDDYRGQLQQGRTTKGEVEKREIQLQGLRTDLKKLNLQKEKEQSSYKQEISSLTLELKKTDNNVSKIEREAYIRAQTNGKVRRIVSTRNGSGFSIRIYIERERRWSDAEEYTGSRHHQAA